MNFKTSIAALAVSGIFLSACETTSVNSSAHMPPNDTVQKLSLVEQSDTEAPRKFEDLPEAEQVILGIAGTILVFGLCAGTGGILCMM